MNNFDEIDNQQDFIKSVKRYWFDGDQKINYKTKWFPDVENGQQEKTDNEIASQFGNLLNTGLVGGLNDWNTTTEGCVSLIIVLDQFSRHIFRLEEKLGISTTDRRIQADSRALEVSQLLFSNYKANALHLPMSQFIFSLMPYRHAPNVNRLEFVLECLKEKEIIESNANELLLRFRKQTVRRLQHLQDRAKLEATDDILERHAFQADESDILKQSLVKTTQLFLQKNIKTPVSVPVLISLSGGVDSMVLSKILILLKNELKLPISRVVAMHIDYANRPESSAEAAYVLEWCNQLGIDCQIRVINEVTRGITNRDEYEKISREIRYGFYQQCIDHINMELNNNNKPSSISSTNFFTGGVIFGHHQGDVQENVISNVMRGCSPLNLSGMTEVSIANGVIIWRPLLSHNKDEIYEFAHRYGVPYFKDSTPSWSTRGKLRTHLMPLLVDMYGAGCLKNLSSLAMESDQTRDLVVNNIYEPFEK
eukprot:gene13394-17960_t